MGNGTWTYAYDYRSRRVFRAGPAPEGAEVITFSGGTSVSQWPVASRSAWDPAGTPSSDAIHYIRGSDYGGGVGGVLYTATGIGGREFFEYGTRGDVTGLRSASTGALSFQATFSAFGSSTSTGNSGLRRQRASTKEEETALGFLNEGFRYRDIATGTFLSRDPAGFVDGPNLYSYVRQNPWSKFDPLGLSEAEAAKEDAIARREANAGNWGGGLFHAFKGFGERMKFWQADTPVRAAVQNLNNEVIPAAKRNADQLPAVFGVPARLAAHLSGYIANASLAPAAYAEAADSLGEGSYNPANIALQGTKQLVSNVKESGSQLVSNPSTSAAMTFVENLVDISFAFEGGRGAFSRGRPSNYVETSCFPAGTPVLQADGGTAPIESLRVGQRVAVPEISGEEGDTGSRSAGESWREIAFQLIVPEHPDGIHDIVLLRPASWAWEQSCENPGDRLWLDLSEMGVEGAAVVTHVKEVEAPGSGPGRLITGTFTHHNSDLREIIFTTPGNNLRVTGLHRLWSDTRSDWTRVAELLPGEILRTSSGNVNVLNISKILGIHQVYNLEVDGAHCYFGGAARILAHNTCGPEFYSVAFEHQLTPAEFGLSHKRHVHLANQALQAGRAVNPPLAAGVPGPAGWGLPPADWIWHHATMSQADGRAGVLQLVPRGQHSSSAFRPLLHPLPNGGGGYKEWAEPAGAPPR